MPDRVGVVTALITPCRPDGTVDHGAVGELIDFQADIGVDGLFVLGTMGQGPMLTIEERVCLTKSICDRARGRIDVTVHVGALPTTAAVRLARAAADAGAHSIASVPPTYYSPDAIMLRGYFEAIAEAAPHLPLFAYNNPQATGYAMRPREIVGLHRAGILAGVKQGSSDVADLDELLSAGVPVWIASTGCLLAGILKGARRILSGVSNVRPDLVLGLAAAHAAGDLSAARGYQTRIECAASALDHPVLGGVHAACSLRGLPGLQPRPPLRLPLNGAETDALRRVLNI